MVLFYQLTVATSIIESLILTNSTCPEWPIEYCQMCCQMRDCQSFSVDNNQCQLFWHEELQLLTVPQSQPASMKLWIREDSVKKGDTDPANKAKAPLVDLSPFRGLKKCPVPADIVGGRSMDSAGGYVENKPMFCGAYGDELCFYYDFETEAWINHAYLPNNLMKSASVIMDGKLWITGGVISGTVPVSDAHIYSNDEVQPSSISLPYPTATHCLVKINDTHVFLLGGNDATGYNTRTETYILDWTNEQWTQMDDITNGRAHHMCGKIGDKIVVIGGKNYDTLVEVFSLETETWSDGPTVAGFYDAEVYQMEDTFLMFGGRNSSGDKTREIRMVHPLTYELIDLDVKLPWGVEDPVVIGLPPDVCE